MSRLLHAFGGMKRDVNEITGQIIGAAIAVHRELGPGMLESTYEACLTFELVERGLRFERQKALPVIYRGHRLDCGYRIDLLVENDVIVEVKSVERLERVHSAQLLSYLRLAKRRFGLLFNFNVIWLVDQGLKRIVNGFEAE
jgi:GxxExxY protein